MHNDMIPMQQRFDLELLVGLLSVEAGEVLLFRVSLAPFARFLFFGHG
jgi:hypothetical protein